MTSTSQIGTTGRALAAALLDLALPGTCAGCAGSPGPLCAGCDAQLVAALFASPLRAMPDPVPIHLPPVTARGPYAGVLARLLAAYKDDDRRDLRGVLAGLLAESIAVSARGCDVVLVPMPSARAAVRRRGDDPVADLARAAAAGLGRPDPVVPALTTVRRLADQATLGHRERSVNLAGAYAVRLRRVREVEGRSILLVDDVVTTGATLAEAARAVRAAGGRVVGAATVAATQRRSRAGPPASGAGGTAPGGLLGAVPPGRARGYRRDRGPT